MKHPTSRILRDPLREPALEGAPSSSDAEGAPGRRTGPPIRVLLVETNDDSTVGGSHRALFDLAVRLDGDFQPVVLFYRRNPYGSRLRERGVEVHDFESERQREKAVHRSGRRPAKWIEVLRAIRRRMRILRRLEIDLVHVHSSPRIGADDWLPAARLVGVPCLASEMLTEAVAPPDRLRRWLQRWYDRIMPVSDHLASALREMGVPAARIVRIYHGIDLEGIRAAGSRGAGALRSELELDPEVLIVTLVGHLRRWKGQAVALDAFARLPPEIRSRAHLVFVGASTDGDEEYRAELDQVIREERLGDHISFLGHRSDIAAILAGSDVALHASMVPEPGGIAALEALALGRPVIASKAGGPAEVIGEDAGLLFDPARPEELRDHLALLLTDPGRRAEFGQAARRRLDEFSLERNLAETQQVYREALAARGGARGRR